MEAGAQRWRQVLHTAGITEKVATACQTSTVLIAGLRREVPKGVMAIRVEERTANI
jgi:hypothetical protein